MITIVSGLPRSGTSLVMQMLVAAGYPVAWNKEPNCDQQNPRGYYEWEQQKKLWQSAGAAQTALFSGVDGKAVKIFPQCFPCLSPAFKYQIIYIDRPIGEVIASQRQMQIDLGRDPDLIKRDELEKLCFHAYAYCRAFKSIIINHANLFNINGPMKIDSFLNKWSGWKHNKRVISMNKCVDPSLRHHNLVG